MDFTLSSFLITFLLLIGCTANDTEKNVQVNEIEELVQGMMKTHEIPGLAVGVIKNGRVIHKGFYGVESLESNKPLSNNTLLKVFSLTKTFVAVSIFKLIDEGTISLEDKLPKFFDGLPEQWQNVSIANLLSHSSGLPDIRQLTTELENDQITDRQLIEKLFNNEMEFATGEQWNYNQTNYIFLKMIIEKFSEDTFEEFVCHHQFAKSDRNQVSFSSSLKTEKQNQAKYYDFNKELKTFNAKKDFSGVKNHPLAGLNITLDEYIQWNQKLDDGALISDSSKALMWTLFKFTNSGRKFMNGWDVYEVNGFDSYGFSGGGVSGFRKFVTKDLTIIVLTTGYKYYAVQDIIIEQIASILDQDLRDENSVLIEQLMAQYFLKDPLLNIDTVVQEIKINHPQKNLEEVFKSIGYTLFFQLNKKKEAIDLFKNNVHYYPESYDTHGSLGYLYFLTEQYKLARVNYVKALELNPENNYSDRRIKEIDNILKMKN